jgi:hypothetical protein
MTVKDQAKHDHRRFQLRQIIKALRWWSDEGGWKNISAIGALIQQKAQELTGIKGDMSTLKFEAEGMLKRLKNEEARSRQLQAQLAQSQQNMMPGAMFPFRQLGASFTITPPLTRRGELEEMSQMDIDNLYREVVREERKKERINYILESEKEYK